MPSLWKQRTIFIQLVFSYSKMLAKMSSLALILGILFSKWESSVLKCRLFYQELVCRMQRKSVKLFDLFSLIFNFLIFIYYYYYFFFFCCVRTNLVRCSQCSQICKIYWGVLINCYRLNTYRLIFAVQKGYVV